nr:Ppx/GppA phosphatase family protein [Aestuariimicrobium ganziense]
MTTVAAIDCGTNSIRLLIASQGPAGELVEHTRITTMVRLGQGVDATGEFHPDALQRTFAACDAYAEAIREHGGVDAVRFVATSAARDARNRDEFAAGVRERLGVDPVVVDGEEEAHLSFTGAVTGVPTALDPVLVMDIGGGSTELIRGEQGRIVAEQSLDMGAVRLRERFLTDDPPTPEQIEAARAYAHDLLDQCEVPLDGIGTFIGVAGTATTMAAVDLKLPTYERSLVHQHVIAQGLIDENAERWLASTVEQVRTEPAMHPQRAEIICAGGLILQAVAQRVGRAMVVSESDILDGIAMDLLASGTTPSAVTEA